MVGKEGKGGTGGGWEEGGAGSDSNGDVREMERRGGEKKRGGEGGSGG